MYNLHELFFHDDEACEVRLLGVHGKNPAWEDYARGTVAGYYKNREAFARVAAALEKAKVPGAYFTPNPVNPSLWARAADRLKVAKNTTQDIDIDCIRWLMCDIDPKRPAGISSTDAEFALAREVAKKITAWLEDELGFGKAIRAESGNGFHLLYRLPDLPNDANTHRLIVDATAAIKARFDCSEVDIDPAVVNPARIWKLYGTTARKGDSTPDRPHRKSRLLAQQPTRLDDVPVTSLELLQKLAAMVPKAAPPTAVARPATGGAPSPAPGKAGAAKTFKERNELGPLDVERYLRHFRVPFTIKPKGAQTLYLLDRCLFNPDHANGEASIIASPNGPLLYQCFHSSCKDMTWQDAKKIISGDKKLAEFCAGYDPNWKPPATEGSGVMAALNVQQGEAGIVSAADVPTPEEVDPIEFFEKRGKRPVFIPRDMAAYIAMYLNPVVHTNNEFWRYNNGIWELFPETKIIQIINAALKRHWQDTFQNSTIKNLKGLVNKEEKEWPDGSGYVPLANGMLEISTMEMHPHDPKYGNRYQLPVRYEPGNKWSSRWWDYLKEIFPGDDQHEKKFILQQFFGYCLLLDCRYQVALFMYGTGANGKSTVLDVLEAMLGHDNCSSMSLEELCERFSTYFLQNKLLNMATETSSRNPLGTELLKKMIAGDKVTCEAKYGHKFQFRPYAKFIAALNEPPVIPDKSYGFGRRILVLNFDRRFTPEEISAKAAAIGGKKVSDWLIAELDGIFAWSLEGLQKLLKQSGFRIPGQVRKDTDQMLETLNPILIFVNEMCEVHYQASVSTVEMWELYKAWCVEGKNRALGRNRFLDQILMTFPAVEKKQVGDDRIMTFLGIGITDRVRDWLAERQRRLAKQAREQGEMEG